MMKACVLLVCLCSSLALELRPQLPGMFPGMQQMPMGMPQMQMGNMMGQMPFGFPQMGQMGQMAQPQWGQFPQQVPVQAPIHAPAAPPAPALKPVSVQQTDSPKLADPSPIGEIAKWAESLGLPKMSEMDLTKLVDMQKSMISRLQALPSSDVKSMQSQQNDLAEQMDSLLAHPSDAGVDQFQTKQELLMNQWATKLGLPAVSAEEHGMMRSQLRRMFDQMGKMPQAQLDELRSKHEQIKSAMQQ